MVRQRSIAEGENSHMVTISPDNTSIPDQQETNPATGAQLPGTGTGRLQVRSLP
jgi:hypothetical protein